MSLEDLFIDYFDISIKNNLNCGLKNHNKIFEFIYLKQFNNIHFKYFLCNYNYDFYFVEYIEFKSKLHSMSAKFIEMLKNRYKCYFYDIEEITNKSTNKEIIEFLFKNMLYSDRLFNYICIKEINNNKILKNFEIKELPFHKDENGELYQVTNPITLDPKTVFRIMWYSITGICILISMKNQLQISHIDETFNF